MGAPVFTEAELRRTLKVAAEFSATVEVFPRLGFIRILAPTSKETDLTATSAEGKNQCDEVFGL
jgi:hypothetical protein